MAYLVDKYFIVVLQLCNLSIEAVQLFLQSHQGSFHGTVLLCQRLAAPHVDHFPGLSQRHGCDDIVCVAAGVGSTYTLGESCQAMDSNVFCNCKACHRNGPKFCSSSDGSDVSEEMPCAIPRSKSELLSLFRQHQTQPDLLLTEKRTAIHGKETARSAGHSC